MSEDSQENNQSKEYLDGAVRMRERLNAVSPTLCLAKWKMVTLHLTTGKTQSCHHPPIHDVPLEGLEADPARLHNTDFKVNERRQMREGKRPPGCSYCWTMEDAAGGGPQGHLSDRHYRSSESWVHEDFDRIRDGGAALDRAVVPSYVEVNFNQACNFKCIYCSPRLSTEWQREAERFGGFALEKHLHNDVRTMAAEGLMPLGVPNDENPYVRAFWRWWPELYPNLKVFRMTGGEPLLDANTWKVLDYVSRHPKTDLELSVTSNLCPPKKEIFEKFLARVQNLEGHPAEGEAKARIKGFSVYVSCDSVGAQAEYIRTGLNYNILKRNVRLLLQNTGLTTVTFINTFNILSLPKLKEFLSWMLELREEFSYERQTGLKQQRIWFDIPTLTHPAWLSIRLLAGSEWEGYVQECIRFMEANLQKEDYHRSFRGFKPYEVLKLRRNLAVMKQSFSPDEQALYHRRFVQYVDELDRRRRTGFTDIFPELGAFYNKPD